MKIKYLGHSSFKLENCAGTVVVTDPYSPEVGFAMPEVAADAVTLSHHHFDHDYVKAVGGNPQVIDSAVNVNVKGVNIIGVNSFHDPWQGTRRGKNLIFKYRIDGVTVCHLGDLGEPCTAELVEKIAPVDVLLIPVGGNYTIDARTAKQYVDAINPRMVIPMHYSDGGNIDIGTVDQFTALFDREDVTHCGKAEIETTDYLTDDKTKIIVLRRA